MSALSRKTNLPTCPLCTEALGSYGGPCTLPCGHNLCAHCGNYLQQRQALCPLCRAPFPPDLPLVVNCELRELMRMAEALTAVEREDGWQAVTTAAKVDLGSCKHGGGSGDGASAPAVRVDVLDVLEGSGGVMDLDPQPWEPDSSSPSCRAPGCNKAFSFVLRPRHHCRCCGQLFCGACTAERMMLPPKFQQCEPQRVCRGCRELLLPIQPLLAGSIAPAVRHPVHDVTDWSAARSLLNPPLSARLETDIYTATNIVRQYVRSVGSLPSERTIPPAILRGCAGLAILSVAKAGAGWSLSLGSGLVVARTPDGGGWSAPSAILSLASSVGWQMGFEVQDLILVLRSHAALKAFCSSQLGIGGSVSVAAGPVGRAAGARALAAVGGGAVVYSYSSTRGAYAGVAVEGTLLSTRDAVNQQFYGRKVSAHQLLVSGAVPPPPAATALYTALEALLEHAGDSAGPQFLSQAARAASEPSLHSSSHLLPAQAVGAAAATTASAPPLVHVSAAAASPDDDDWEAEAAGGDNSQAHHWGRHATFDEAGAPSRGRMPAYGEVPGYGEVAGARQLYPTPSQYQDEEPQPFGCLFD